MFRDSRALADARERAAAVLVVLGPNLAIGSNLLLAGAPAHLEPVQPLLVWLTAAIVSLSGLLFLHDPRSGRVTAAFGLGAWIYLHAALFRPSPAGTLAVFAAVLLLFHWVWPIDAATSRGVGTRKFALRLARLAGQASLGAWLLFVFGHVARGREMWIAVGGLYAFSVLAAVVAIVGARAWSVRRSWRRIGLATVAFAGAIATWGDWPRVLTWAAILPGMITFLRFPEETTTKTEDLWWEPFIGNPARMLLTTFLLLCAAGTVVLTLPACSAGGRSVGLLDAAFTAVSAVCVTGLVVLDTPHDFGFVGQLVILALIQMGGLGIMTFSTAALAALGRRMSIRHEGIVANLLSGEDRTKLQSVARRILIITFGAEAVGGAMLTALFLMRGDAPAQAIWRGTFTAVSAFCNAGFALQTKSLIPYQDSGAILHIVAGLIVLGGLSPAVVAALPRLIRRQPTALQVKLAVVATVVLLVAGTAIIAVLEWNNTLGGLTLAGRLNNAWFQSVTTRTAGFNSLDIAAMRPLTLVLMVLFMFVGGSPGGTAGGIKTTTAAMLVLMVAATLRGRTDTTAFGRRVPVKSIFKASALATVGMAFVVFGFVAVRLTQNIEPLAALFEVASALGTVGLSVGGTAALDAVGKVLIAALMFVGRTGPLTLFLFLADTRPSAPWTLPEEDVDVG